MGNPAIDAHKRNVREYFQDKTDYWNEIYRLPDLVGKIHQLRQAKVLKLVSLLSLSPRAKVLVVGCGAGGEVLALAKSGYEVHAMDQVPAMIDQALRRAMEAGVQDRVSASVGDIDSLAFHNTFDLVLAIGVTPYLQAVGQAIRETARALKPGGCLIITAENRWGARRVLDPWRNPAFQSSWKAIRTLLSKTGLHRGVPPRVRALQYSIKEFDARIRAAGLNKVTGMTLGFGPFTIFGYHCLPDRIGVEIHGKLQTLANREIPVLRSLGSQYLVLARKNNISVSNAPAVLAQSQA